MLLLCGAILADYGAEAFDQRKSKKGKVGRSKGKSRSKKKNAGGASKSREKASRSTSSRNKGKSRNTKSTKMDEKSTDSSASTSKSSSSSASTSADTMTFDLEHSVAPWGDAFTSRGTIEVKISQRSKQVRVDSSKIRTSMTAEETSKLRRLAEEGEFYRLRLPSLPGSNRKVVASIPACALFVAGFEETISLHMDLSGNLVSFDYATTSQLSSICSKQVLAASMREQEADSGETVEMQTSVVLARPRQAHRIPTRIMETLPPPPGLEHLRVKTKEEEAANQPGFFRRYWYIIVPVMLMMLVK